MILVENKKCITCYQDRSLSDYHNNKRRLSGKNNECKYCCAIKVKNSANKNKVNFGRQVLPEYKVCSICNNKKPISDFHIRKESADGRRKSCKCCTQQRIKEWKGANDYYTKNKEQLTNNRNKWIEKNPNAVKKASKKYYDNNKDTCAKRYKLFYENNKDKRKTYCKEHRAKNIEKYRKVNKEWRNTKGNTPFRKLRKNVSSRVLRALKDRKMSKSCMELIGCSLEHLIKHIESNFTNGMNWDNMGRGGWHIDHKKPISWFNLFDNQELLKAMNYKNLQPLWESENCKKGNRYAHV